MNEKFSGSKQIVHRFERIVLRKKNHSVKTVKKTLDLDLLHLQFLTEQTFLFSQRASFSLRVSVMKAKNLMAKDANGEEDKTVM